MPSPTETTRYFLDYTTCGVQHTMTMRCDASVTDSQASTHFSDLFSAMEPLLLLTQVVRMRRAEEGSNISFPAIYSGTEEFGSTPGTGVNVPDFWSFTGKDSSGRQAKVEMFGRSISANNNYRLAAVDDSSVEAALAELATSDPVWLSAGGSTPFWNQYANQTVSAYWQRQQRV